MHCALSMRIFSYFTFAFLVELLTPSTCTFYGHKTIMVVKRLMNGCMIRIEGSGLILCCHVPGMHAQCEGMIN